MTNFLSPEHALAFIQTVCPAVVPAINRLRSQFAAASNDGVVTVWEIYGLVGSAQAELMALLRGVDIQGALKKEAVLAMLGLLIDEIPVVPLPWYLVWLQPYRASIRAQLKAEVLAFADKQLEALYAQFVNPTNPPPPDTLKVFPRVAG